MKMMLIISIELYVLTVSYTHLDVYKRQSNNRELKEHHSHINYSNYREEITILKATGMRRESLDKVNVDNFRYDSKGYPVAVKSVSYTHLDVYKRQPIQ